MFTAHFSDVWPKGEKAHFNDERVNNLAYQLDGKGSKLGRI